MFDHALARLLREIIEGQRASFELQERIAADLARLIQLLSPSQPATALIFQFPNFTLGDDMTFTLAPGQSVPFTVAPIKADGSPSTAKLSNPSFASADPTVFSVAVDPANPNNGGILSALATAPQNATAVLSGSATATEPDGTTTETVTGVVTIIVATPPPAPAAALAFTFGTPK